MVLACSADDRLGLVRGGQAREQRALRDRLRLELMDLEAQLQQALALAAVAGEGHQVVGGGERVGVDAHSHAARHGAAEQVDRCVGDHEVRRLDSDRLVRRLDQARQRCGRQATAAETEVVVVLAWRVADELDSAPRGLRAEPGEGLGRGLDRCADLGREVLRRSGVGVQPPVDLLDLGVADLDVLLHQAEAVVELLDRHAERAGPEQLEARGHAPDHGADQQHVAVAEVVLVVVVEVLIGHVAAAGDRDLAVDQQDLVVHALVDAAEVGGDVHHALLQRRADRGLRVIDADVDVRMAGQREQRLVRRVDQQVVDDHADLHAALRGPQQRFGRQDADVVGAPDEVLHLERALGVVGQPGTGDQRLGAGVEHVAAALAGVRRDLLVEEAQRSIAAGARQGREQDARADQGSWQAAQVHPAGG